MKIETIVNAFELAGRKRLLGDPKHFHKRGRQVVAFRSRIIRVDKEKNDTIDNYQAIEKIIGSFMGVHHDHRG